MYSVLRVAPSALAAAFCTVPLLAWAARIGFAAWFTSTLIRVPFLLFTAYSWYASRVDWAEQESKILESYSLRCGRMLKENLCGVQAPAVGIFYQLKLKAT